MLLKKEMMHVHISTVSFIIHLVNEEEKCLLENKIYPYKNNVGVKYNKQYSMVYNNCLPEVLMHLSSYIRGFDFV